MGKAALFVVLLISAILIVIAVKTLFVRYPENPTNITAPIDRAKKIECVNNLRNIRMKINLYYSENSRYPNSLNELSNVAPFCPVSNKNYQYDNTNGQITCPDHPGY